MLIADKALKLAFEVPSNAENFFLISTGNIICRLRKTVSAIFPAISAI